ncbi:hypothetical protein QFZ99_007623 [Paraburkholderia atlantica]
MALTLDMDMDMDMDMTCHDTKGATWHGHVV